MELALPHVVVRLCGPGLGQDLLAALSVHPLEVSEARDVEELHRVSYGRPPLLVVVVDPPDANGAVAETRLDFPTVPILIVADSAQGRVRRDTATRSWVDSVHSGQPLQDLCWHVLEALSRAAHLSDPADRPLGPESIEVDEQGVITSAAEAMGVGCRVRAGESLLARIEPRDRGVVANALEWAKSGEAQFHSVRLVDGHGRDQPVAVGLKKTAAGRFTILVQPLTRGGPIVGRHVNNRDPITGLLTRWEMSRALELREQHGADAGESALLLLTLDELSAISSSIGHAQTDVVLLGVASALSDVFPYPALTSRIMGDSFLAYLPRAGTEECLRRGQRLLAALGELPLPGFAPHFTIRGSIGVATMNDGDHDLAVRLAEAAAAEARAAGGNRVIVAGSADFTRIKADELMASMDLGSWEVWLQPVVRPGTDGAEYHEALARFDSGHRQLASRADFFTAGRADGLLERFDRMMLQRVLEMLASHPNATISMNVSHESFVSSSFPASFVDLIQRVPDGRERVVLEIASRCVVAPDDVVRPRLEGLAEAGIAVAIDDFGSGFCRLRYLTRWPLAFVKLDQLATGYVDDDPLQRDFVRTVVSLCRARGITTVAEYTRSTEQLARLVEDGVDLFQGELFGMPRPAAEALAPSAMAGAPA